MRIDKKITKNNELYLYMNGKLIYKKWLDTGQSKVFDVMAYDKYTYASYTDHDLDQSNHLNHATLNHNEMSFFIETERLLLREITLDDAEDMFQLHANPDVQKYTGEPPVESMKAMEQAIQTRISNYKKYGYGRWATFLKDENQFVGWAGLAYLPEFDEIDLGYRFLPEYWGMSIATEASHAILKYGFDTLGLKRIIAIAMKENKASVRVMEKVGMAFDKFAPYEPEGEDVVWYWCDKELIAKKE